MHQRAAGEARRSLSRRLGSSRCSERGGPLLAPAKQAGSSDGALWRRGRDSNPRYGFPHTHFPGVRLQPLGHPSGLRFLAQAARISPPAVAAQVADFARRRNRGADRAIARAPAIHYESLTPSARETGRPASARESEREGMGIFCR
jgi:hypothetical protein